MKQPKKKPTTRRQFLKKSGRVAAASALGTAVVGTSCETQDRADKSKPGASTVKEPVVPSEPSGANAVTKQLGAVVPQPEGSVFTLQRRLPDWHPDTADVGGIDTKYFEEEFLRKVPDPSGRRFLPFKVPNGDVPGSEFQEPLQNAPAGDWLKFNSWILGSALPDPPVQPFDQYLVGHRHRRPPLQRRPLLDAPAPLP